MPQKTTHLHKSIAPGKILIVATVLFSALSCQYGPEQPINFNHKVHYQYFSNGTHKKDKFAMHEEMLGEIPEELENGECEECHGTFEEAAEDTPGIEKCGGCHQIFLSTDLRERPSVRPCVGCHRNTIQGHKASIPNIENCIICHQQSITQDPEESKLLAYFSHEERINWIRVNDKIKGDTHFSHERHVAGGKLDCRDCHGMVDEATTSLRLRMSLKMEDCMECHEEMIANNDCLACHY